MIIVRFKLTITVAIISASTHLTTWPTISTGIQKFYHFAPFLLGAQHIRDSVENKPASLLVVSLGKALNGMPPSLCGRQMVGPSSLPVVVAQSDERHANRA